MNLPDEIKKLEGKLLNSATRKSGHDLDELIADEFVEFASSGKVFNKKQTLENLLNEQDTTFSMQDFMAKSLNHNVVLATYTATKEHKNEKKMRSLRSSVWKNNDGKWQLIFHQGTVQKE